MVPKPKMIPEIILVIPLCQWCPFNDSISTMCIQRCAILYINSMKPKVTSRACREVHQANRSRWVSIKGKGEKSDSALCKRGGRVHETLKEKVIFDPVFV